jgi:hypothetical protein
MERPVSRKHRPMSMENRAAQFSAFAALTGHEERIKETARQSEQGFDEMGRRVDAVEGIENFVDEFQEL